MTRAALPLVLALLAAGKPVKDKAAREPAKATKEGAGRAADDAFDDAPRAAPASPTAVKLLTPAPRKHGSQVTACGSCHNTTSWSETRFNHARTGFPLTGKHTAVGCKSCHAVDFQRSVPAACSGCHLDVHAGELGGRCEGCHDTESWKSRFPADAHRFTGFPLVGRHAALPCGECHFTEAGGRFSRAVSGCADCHQTDLQRTVGSAIDHQALGFSPLCQSCHQAWTFKGARFPSHDTCFLISFGSHARLGCAECHQAGFPPAVQPGSCNTGTATCIDCHAHEKNVSDPQHVNVFGYQWANQRCVGCHKEGR
jgi:hypothetical protein